MANKLEDIFVPRYARGTARSLAGLRKQGIAVERSRTEAGGASVYKIGTAPVAEAA